MLRWDTNVRESAVLGLVRAGGIVVALDAASSILYWDQVGLIMAVDLCGGDRHRGGDVLVEGAGELRNTVGPLALPEVDGGCSVDHLDRPNGAVIDCVKVPSAATAASGPITSMPSRAMYGTGTGAMSSLRAAPTSAAAW